ncbi:Stk1 family PASTA domain-containing Ser/Thr kinase [Solihabitans fulvus]|uniref:non-specific serine/threonine protein kinase n=1 Tax=Solihabitans fulvus TaxID=1892852 RepID=A0A5B2X1C5_9PSEU|nr:Stk1 family PASTA domain-containing Ser/Thr kinase [Solihabitans fulvus]KAA2256537.1 Stk1 family PASTA domain-containing Ser/Thr kinase [Solihabitans fulvus]
MDRQGTNVIGGLLEQRYRVDGFLARGGMSTVYRGVDTRLDRPVAIKVMDPQFSADRSFVARFEQEARAAARLHHPNVVAVYDQGVDRAPGGDNVFLVMELVTGGTLRDLLTERGRLPVPLALSVLEPVLSALAAAHRAGLIHRDVKPENVLIGHSGAVKVADFGLVRAVASAGTTSDSVILGTVAYLSPEQVATGASDARSDVYAAGLVLFEMLTGKPPYTGDTAISVAYRHVNDDVPAPSTVLPDLPPALDQLVLRATRRDPAERPADAEAFLAEVERVRESLAARRVTVPTPMPGQDEQTVRVEPVRLGVGRTQPVTHQAPPESAAERTVVQHTAAMPVRAAQVGPAGAVGAVGGPGGPVGPQGTRAISREELGAALAKRPEPARKQQRPAAPADRYAAERNRSRRTFIVWISIVLVLAVAIGVVAWWMGSGRWTAVPQVAGLDQAHAIKALQDADLSPQVLNQSDNTVPAGQALRTDPTTGAQALRGGQVKLLISKGKPIVPPVTVGSAPEAAEQLIRDAGLTPKRDDAANVFDQQVPEGKVITVSPNPGAELPLGGVVTVVLSKGPPPKPVPDVSGHLKDEAFQLLQAAGLAPYDAPAEFSDKVDGGKVIRTTPAAGSTIAPKGDNRVAVVVSTAVTVPNVGGQKGEDAAKALEALGLKVSVQSFLPGGGGSVLNQSVPAGTRVQPGSAITIILFI